MNQCQLMGRLVRDPELKYTPQGTAVTSFTLAVDRRFNRDKADYINIIAWRQTAEFVAKHFAKGQRVAIVGSCLLYTSGFLLLLDLVRTEKKPNGDNGQDDDPAPQ